MSGFKMTGTDPDPAKTDHQRADRDPNLTRPIEDGPPVQSSTADDLVGKSGSTTLGNIRPFYSEDNVEEIDQQAAHPSAVTPDHSSNSWDIEDDNGISRGSDPYRNQGLSGPDAGRGYLENQG